MTENKIKSDSPPDCFSVRLIVNLVHLICSIWLISSIFIYLRIIMEAQILITIILCCFPLIATICGGIIIFMSYFESKNYQETRIKSLLISYFICDLSIWFGVVCYFLMPESFLRINFIFYLALTCTNIIYYHFVFLVTHRYEQETFPLNHYIIPILICIAFLFVSFLTPWDIQIIQLSDKAGINPVGRSTYFLPILRITILLIISIIYTYLSTVRLREFRKYKYKIPLSTTYWMELGAKLSIVLLVSFLFVLFFWEYPILNRICHLITATIAFSQILLITYNVLKRNYPIISFLPRKKEFDFNELSPDKNSLLKKERKIYTRYSRKKKQPKIAQTALTRKLFEKYIVRYKPFINPELTINELLGPLNINRTYLSIFINKTYGMNFKSLMNQYRLQELHRLEKRSSNKNKSKVDLIKEVGFGSYRNYLRTKSQGTRIKEPTILEK